MTTEVETIIVGEATAWTDPITAADLAPAILAALDAAGLVVVPKEPSKAMSIEGGIAIEDAMFAEGKLVFDGAADCYRAMIGAAR